MKCGKPTPGESQENAECRLSFFAAASRRSLLQAAIVGLHDSVISCCLKLMGGRWGWLGNEPTINRTT
jgi:hypothetical protein